MRGDPLLCYASRLKETSSPGRLISEHVKTNCAFERAESGNTSE